MSNLWKHWPQLGLVQILDLAVIAVLIYLGMVWLKHRASRALAGVLVLVVLLYTLARYLDMPFTLAVFREGFTVIAVALLLIFQKDLRWAFERLFSSSAWSAGPSGMGDDLAETIAEAAGALAKSKTGALMVFEGSEPLDQHIRGGIDLDAKITLPLLMSIFDDSSAGHDGAVIFKNGRAKTFGAHLPLAGNELPDAFGTRHSAGLGLAEVSDALVIVVSEERGAISVCHDGKLEPVESVASLKQRMQAFHSAHNAETRQSEFRQVLTRNWTLKLAAVLMAGLLSVVFADRTRTVERSYEVPVEFANRPQNWLGETPDPPRVRVTLSGSETAFDLFDPSKLKVSLDAGRLEEGTHAIRIRNKDLNVKTPLKIERVHPPALNVTTYRLKPVKVRVSIPKVGLPPDGFSVATIKLQSETASLLWPVKHSQPPEEIWTDPLVLRRVTSNRTVRLRLQIPSNAKPAPGQETSIPVTVEIRKVANAGGPKLK